MEPDSPQTPPPIDPNLRVFVFPTVALRESNQIQLLEITPLDREAWKVLARLIRKNPRLRHYRADVDRIDQIMLLGDDDPSNGAHTNGNS